MRTTTIISKRFVVLLVVAILAVPTLITLGLRQSGQRAAKADQQLGLYVTDLEIQDGIHRLIIGPSNASEARRQLVENRGRAEEYLREAVDVGLPPSTAAQVTTLTHQYTRAVDTKVQLLTSGQVTEADALDTAQINPALGAVNTFLELERSRLTTQVGRDQAAGNLGVLLTALLLLILGSLGQRARIQRWVGRRGKPRSGARAPADQPGDPLVSGPVPAAHDVSDRLTMQNEMEHRAMHDTLTGLPNRALLADRFEQALRAAERSGDSVGLLLLDLDRFKEVNDTFGHHYGDELLRQIAPRLTAVMRNVDTLARLGGDEFAVLLQDVHAVDDAIEVANALLAALSPPFHVEGVDLDVEASVGVVVSGEHGQDPVTLMQHADIAMYIAKRQHLGVFAYDPSMDGHSATKLAMIGDLRRGLQRGELVLYYQPKVSIATGDLVGAEGLVRWQHPEHGLVFPDAFIPLAERTGLINPLTRHILDTALAQARVWIDADRPLPIAVNLSARNLHNERFAAQVDELLAVHDVPAHLLELEVTESAIMIDPVRACQMLEKLSDLGIRLSLDDFGAGYTSLSQLKALPISEIKIDRSFVKTMTEDRRDSVIVQSIIALGHNLGLTLIAEGVETEEHLTTLASFGCDVVQGYYMTRPIPVAAFDTWSAGRRITPMPTQRICVLDTPGVDHTQAIATVTSLPAPQLVALPDVVTDRALSFEGGLAPEQNGQSDHVVFLFDNRQQLLPEVTTYISDGLSYDGHVLVVATAEHRQNLRAALPQLRLQRAEGEGRYRALDAEQTLAQFMVDGLPDPALFEQSVGAMVRSHLMGTSVLSIYCELVAVLCQADNLIGALRVEELWNELQRTATFSLFCAHALADVQAQPGDALAQICDRHTRIHMTRSLDQDANAAAVTRAQ